jgi:hypothetical protein
VDRKETRAKTKDLAFVYPLEGVPQDTALLNILMECWSNGVLINPFQCKPIYL